MKLPVPKLRPRAWLYVPLFALGLALGLNVFLKQQQFAKANRVADVKTEFKGPRTTRLNDPDVGKLSASLLTDSILSIIQSYYVDVNRVDNKSLVETAFDALATNPRVKSGKEADGYWLEIDKGERRHFPLGATPRYSEMLEAFTDIAAELDKNHLESLGGEGDPEKNAPGSVTLLAGLLGELDAHSSLLSPDAYRELRQGTEGQFGGLGVLVGIRDNLLTVIKPLPHSPAQRAGIKKHDKILGIDGVMTYGYSLDELVEYMRGEPGTAVKLSLLRDGAPSPTEMSLEREVINVDSVTTKDVSVGETKILHLTIESFSSRTSREVLAAIKKAREKNGGKLHGLVLDLRSNPGGLLDQAVQVADLFLQSGVIVSTKGRREEIESAGSGIDETKFPITVLMDGDSASASEIVAGALQDHGRAVVIGQPSFGKGSVQTIFELPGERALKLTIARYYTPDGRSIQNVGIIPDVWLQPVAQGTANENLFGTYRYKNERFLKNHLEVDSPAGKQGGPRIPARKAYYLTQGEHQEGDDRKEDREMEFALSLIKKVHETYGDNPPDGTGRATHWLGLAGPVLAAQAEDLDKKARDFLANTMKVDWGAADPHAVSPDLELTLDQSTSKTVVPGESLKLKWTITNNEKHKVERLSVFVRSEASGFETKEVLLGGVEGKTARNGILEVPIPQQWEAGPLLLRVGVAADAWPARHAAADFRVDVGRRPVAELTADVTLVEESGGKVPRTLESKEKARLRIDLYNAGDAPARDASLKVINLAGSQITIAKDEVQLAPIPPGGNKLVYVDIVGGKALFTASLGLGLYVESQDLKQPLRHRFEVDAKPNTTKVSNVIGH